jgi:GNAT superfamily N-acetyltransferase
VGQRPGLSVKVEEESPRCLPYVLWRSPMPRTTSSRSWRTGWGRITWRSRASPSTTRFAIFLKDAHDAVLGGVLGHIWGKWLRVAILWLAEPVRGQGYGRQLLLATEAYARERGCEQVRLSTFSFQARPFYEKLGYDVFATLEDCAPGHREYFLSKPLGEGPEPPSPEKGTA